MLNYKIFFGQQEHFQERKLPKDCVPERHSLEGHLPGRYLLEGGTSEGHMLGGLPKVITKVKPVAHLKWKTIQEKAVAWKDQKL